MRTYSKLFIGGKWVAAASGENIDVISPHSEEIVGRTPAANNEDVDRAVAAARAAFDDGPWPRLRAAERADQMTALLGALQMRSDDLATTITAEMGSPISFSRLGQVMAANMVLDYFINLTRSYAFEEVRPG